MAAFFLFLTLVFLLVVYLFITREEDISETEACVYHEGGSAYGEGIRSDETSEEIILSSWKLSLNCIVTLKQIDTLKKLIVEDNKSLCETCFNTHRDNSNSYSYLFDIGVCEKCLKTKVVVYIPLLKLHTEYPELEPRNWYTKLPRRKVDIEDIV